MLTWLFPYSQLIVTGAASALPPLPAFLQIIHSWLDTGSLWQDQVHAHGTSQLRCLLQAPWLGCPWPKTGMKQVSKIRHKPFGMNEPSLPRTDPCLVPVIHVANVWKESEMKAKIIILQLLTISLILFVVTQKRRARIPPPATCLQPFYMLYLQPGPYFLLFFFLPSTFITVL